MSTISGEDHETINLHRTAIWGCRLTHDRAQATPRIASTRWGRLILAADGRTLSVAPGNATLHVPDLAAYAGKLASAATLAFAPTESYARLYLRETTDRSGTFLYEFDAGRCAVAYSRILTAIDDFELGWIANLHLVPFERLDERDWHSALRHTCTLMADVGCISASVLDQGHVPRTVLAAAGFTASEDELIFSLRGRPATLNSLPTIELPVSLDFIDIVGFSRRRARELAHWSLASARVVQLCASSFSPGSHHS